MDKNEHTPSISYDNLDNRFLFVTLAAKRALQLQKGARPRVDHLSGRKPTVIAMTEVLQNKVEFDAPAGKIKNKRPVKR